MPEAEYHARPELSSHDARDLLASPAVFRWNKDSGTRVEKPEFDLGTAIHSLVLGTGAQPVAYPVELLASNGAVSTTAAKEWAEEQREAGRIPVKAAVLDTINAASESVLANPDARMLLEVPGHAEATLVTTDPVTGVDVRCRFDFLPDGPERLIVDLKTDRDVSPEAFAGTVDRLGYHIQRSFYLDALGFELGEEAGRHADFRFVAVETEPPYRTAVYSLDLDFCDMGDVETRRARELYAACVATNDWPGLHTPTTELKPRMAAIYRFQEKYGELGR